MIRDVGWTGLAGRQPCGGYFLLCTIDINQKGIGLLWFSNFSRYTEKNSIDVRGITCQNSAYCHSDYSSDARTRLIQPFNLQPFAAAECKRRRIWW